MGPGIPVAWSPEGDRVLAENVEGTRDQLVIIGLDGARTSLAAHFPTMPSWPGAVERNRLYRWAAEGPQLVRRLDHVADGPATLPETFNGDANATYGDAIVLADANTGQEQPLLDTSVGIISRHAALSRDGAWLFAWALNCAGLDRLSCGADLYRISLADRSRRILLRAAETGPLAVSDDGRKLAISSKTGVAIHDLAP